MQQMQIDFTSISSTGRTIALNLEPGELNPELKERGCERERLTGPLECKVTLKRFGGKVYIEGSLKTAAEFDCVRCLESFEQPFEAEFSLVGVGIPREEEQVQAEKELATGELELQKFDNERIDLKQLAIEQLVLALPGYPVCSSSCKGLCPGCGRDLNRDKCSCGPKKVDPRLAALANFKPKR